VSICLLPHIFSHLTHLGLILDFRQFGVVEHFLEGFIDAFLLQLDGWVLRPLRLLGRFFG
jgi:hypothetical protein